MIKGLDNGVFSPKSCYIFSKSQFLMPYKKKKKEEVNSQCILCCQESPHMLVV